MSVKVVRVNDARTFKCRKCGKENAVNCGYLERIESLDGIDYDCGFPWEESLADSPNCEDCPLLLCKECKDMLIVNSDAFIKTGREDSK